VEFRSQLILWRKRNSSKSFEDEDSFWKEIVQFVKSVECEKEIFHSISAKVVGHHFVALDADGVEVESTWLVFRGTQRPSRGPA
jgi:hypothetical protein